jgi:hypothetical protein
VQAETAVLADDKIEGAFFVRPVGSAPGTFAITMVTSEQKLANYQVVSNRPTPGAGAEPVFVVKGAPAAESFPSVAALVHHYATTPHGLLGQKLAFSADELSRLGLQLAGKLPHDDRTSTYGPKQQQQQQQQQQQRRRATTAFVRADTNGDGALDTAEFSASLSAAPPVLSNDSAPLFDFGRPGLTAEQAKRQLAMLRARKEHARRLLDAEQLQLRSLLNVQASGERHCHCHCHCLPLPLPLPLYLIRIALPAAAPLPRRSWAACFLFVCCWAAWDTGGRAALVPFRCVRVPVWVGKRVVCKSAVSGGGSSTAQPDP